MIRLWDAYCFHRSQRHVLAALQAMNQFDYAKVREELRAAKRWERRRPNL